LPASGDNGVKLYWQIEADATSFNFDVIPNGGWLDLSTGTLETTN